MTRFNLYLHVADDVNVVGTKYSNPQHIHLAKSVPENYDLSINSKLRLCETPKIIKVIIKDKEYCMHDDTTIYQCGISPTISHEDLSNLVANYQWRLIVDSEYTLSNPA
jgi:hypothetical protein